MYSFTRKVKLKATGYQPFVVEFWVFSLSLCQAGLRFILVILLFFLLFDGASILSLRNCDIFGKILRVRANHLWDLTGGERKYFQVQKSGQHLG